MRKALLITVILSIALAGPCQTVADFENFNLPLDTFLNGSDPDTEFRSGNILLENDFTEQFGSWSGFAISTMTDTTTPGFTNQYSSIPGRGVNGSGTYAVSYVLGNSTLYTMDMARGSAVRGCYITNSTFAYLSMTFGDQFAKKFGGPSGTDPDYFRLTIKGFFNGTVKEDSVVFYLADFRSDESAEDYIIDDWTYVDLSSIGPVDSLRFSLASSDNGSFGMNTPAYFCIDGIETQDRTSATDALSEIGVAILPNPCADHIRISGNSSESYRFELIQNSGQVIMRKMVKAGDELDLSAWPSGHYIARILSDGRWYTSGVIRQ